MKNSKKMIKTTSKVTKLSIIGLCLLGALLMPQNAVAQTVTYDEYKMEFGDNYGHDEYIRNLRYSGSEYGIALVTKDILRMSIGIDGDVGIGGFANLNHDTTTNSLFIRGPQRSEVELSLSGVGAISKFYNTSSMGALGTTGFHPFTFFTNNTERMRIDPHGNIGIGTTPESISQGTNLHVKSDRRSQLHLETGASGYQSKGYVLLETWGTTPNVGLHVGVGLPGSTDQSRLFLDTNNKTGLTVYHDGTSAKAFVGIGTVTPLAPLHVVGGIRGNGTAGAIKLLSDHGNVNIGAETTNFAHFRTDRSKFYFDKTIVNTGSYASADSNLVFSTGATGSSSGNTRMTISKTSGNVGIGATPNDSYRLKVDGTVHASSFVSTATSFPDYVFEDNYTVMPLDKVEAYVKKHKHLPNMPSEKDVVSEGLDIPSVLDKSVENIETLYLHLIDMHKDMEALKRKVEQLERENSTLKSAINKQ